MAKDYTLQLDETIKGNIDQDTLNSLIQITIARIGTEVSWDHFEAYLAAKLPPNDELFDNLHALIFAHFHDLEKSETSLDKNLFKLTFKNAQSAQAFFDFTQHTFPIINSEYPKIDNKEITLTEEQHFFCRRAVKLKTGQLPTNTLEDYYLKTLRADEFDYSDRYIKGVIPGINDKRRLQNLRYNNRSKFTVAGDGSIVERTSKAALKEADKNGFSQIQSCTLLDSKALTPAFGFDRNKNPKLYGILSYKDDIQLNRLLIRDGGTVGRPFDVDTVKTAENLSSKLRDPLFTQLYSALELDQFKNKITLLMCLKDSTNEVLARMRYNPFRSMICICADNLEARLLACDFSNELLEYYAEYAKSKGHRLNPKFKPPIIYYLKNTTWVHIKRFSNIFAENPLHNIYIYTRSMRHNDLLESLDIHNDVLRTDEKLLSNMFEYLLGLQNISLELLLKNTYKCIPLALHMMRVGHVRMLLRLLKPNRTNAESSKEDSPSLSALVFDELITQGCFKKNDPIISLLIVEEAFELATKVIHATASNIEELEIEEKESNGRIDNRYFTYYIMRKGNPRHFEYMGLDEMLKKAAKHHYWIAVRLCLKEFPHIKEETMHCLFTTACNQRTSSKNDPDIVFLLQKISFSAKYAIEAFQKALTNRHWDLVELLITYYHNIEIFHLGSVLIEALRHKQHKLAILILSKNIDPAWRFIYGQNYHLTSALFLGIQHDCNDLLPQSWDLEQKHPDGYTEARCGLAKDLAQMRKNTQALTIIGSTDSKPSLIAPNNTKLSVCYLIFEALFANQPAIAEYRLNHYGLQFQLLPSNIRNIITAIHQFSDVFEGTLTHFSFLLYQSDLTYSIAFFDSLVDLTLKYKDISLLRALQTVMHHKFCINENKTEEMIIKSSLKRISPNNIETIQLLALSSTKTEIWNRELCDIITLLPTPYGFDNEKLAPVYTIFLSIMKNRNQNTPLDESLIEDVFYSAITSKNTVLTAIILKDTPLSESLSEKILTKAITYSQTRYFLYLIKHYEFTFTQKHLSIEYSAEYHSKGVIILQELHKPKYRNKFSSWDYFNLWQICTVYDHDYERMPTDSRKLFLGLLEPNIMRHYTLIILVALFNNRYKGYMGTFWPNLQALLNSERVKKGTDDTLIYNNKSKILLENCDHHPILLKTLNDYFDNTDKIPDEDLINNTYQKVMVILEQALPPVRQIPFFNSSQRGLFNYETYYYLKDIDDLINQNKIQAFKLTSDEIGATRLMIDESFQHQTVSGHG